MDAYMLLSLETLLGGLALEPTGDHQYRAGNIPLGGEIVFGGQLLAQTIVAASLTEPDKYVKTVSTVFARGASMAQPVDISVDILHSGRAFASSAVTISQGERLCTHSVVLLSTAEPDVIRHGDGMPDVQSPESATAGNHAPGAWEIRVVDGVDIDDPDVVGPPELQVWTRFVGAPDDQVTSQALLAFATDGFLIGTAMRPHAGVGQAEAHKTLSTGVVGHTLTFHEPFAAADWMLLAHRSPYAGRGRSYGRADVFTQQGSLVASFVQDNMIRRIPAGRAPSAL
jgi:acyl-CoA thioesterase